jgi:DNA topoisomerase-1
MIVAQKLYEAGHISYMRTDSTNLSEQAIQAIETEITSSFGAKYATPRRYKSKSANAQEAHEAIRPTYFEKAQISGDRDESRLYELIWKRAMASQMAEAVLEKTLVKIGISTLPKAVLQAEGEVLKFDGFLKLYLESNDDEDEDEVKGMLPPLKVNQELPLKEMKATERQTRGPSRYSEAGLVKKLEELGIGRPSTYAPTISKIMEEGRGYVVKESKDGVEQIFQVLKLENDKITTLTLKENTGSFKNRLVPTDMGITVADFLDENFVEIMNYSFTADIEEKFDEIAFGKISWTKMLNDFYFPFHDLVVQTMESASRPTRERILGKDPITGLTILTRMTRVGPVVQMGAQDELKPDEKPKYGNLVAGQSIETLTFDEALLLFSLPRDLGTYLEEKVSIGKGKFGPYVKFGEKFISIPKSNDPFTLTLDDAILLIDQKEKEDAPVYNYQNNPVTKGKGRFGPFLKWKDFFINIPKKYNPDIISEKEMEELIIAKINKENTRFIQQWESQNISIERGRWGPFIRFKKEMISFPKTDGVKVDDDMAAQFDIEAIKKIIEKQLPDAFKVKTTAKKSKAK